MEGGGGPGGGRGQPRRTPALPPIAQLASPHRPSTDSSPPLPPETGGTATQLRQNVPPRNSNPDAVVGGLTTQQQASPANMFASPATAGDFVAQNVREPSMAQSDLQTGSAIAAQYIPKADSQGFPRIQSPIAETLPLLTPPRPEDDELGRVAQMSHGHTRSDPTFHVQSIEAGSSWEPFTTRTYHRPVRPPEERLEDFGELKAPQSSKLPPSRPWPGPRVQPRDSQEGLARSFPQRHLGPHFPQMKRQRRHQQQGSTPTPQLVHRSQDSEVQYDQGQTQSRPALNPQDGPSRPSFQQSPPDIQLPHNFANISNLQTLVQHSREFSQRLAPPARPCCIETSHLTLSLSVCSGFVHYSF